jgi:hypothetical protein
MQVRPPVSVLHQVIGQTLRQKDVSGIATVHHPLRDVNSSTSDVCPIVDIGNLIDGAAVNTHA